MSQELLVSKIPFDLERHGIRFPGPVLRNAPAPVLYEETVRRGLGSIGAHGQLVVKTGAFTGRSPEDKFVVREPSSEHRIDWGSVNRGVAPERFDALRRRVLTYFEHRPLYVQDLYAGADTRHRISVRLISDSPWHALFARTLFIRPQEEDLQTFEPEWTILHAPFFQANPAVDGTRSGTFIMLHFGARMVLIGGTQYAGEIKKSIFSVMNYVLPLKGVLSMHCSANKGREQGDVALFFGLSGTGKTTLSADPGRVLIGDDEHGWSEQGVFNIEGGCYAKVIRLSRKAEPEIWQASHSFGAVLENVVMDPVNRRLNLKASTHTENTRAAYPIELVKNADPGGQGGVPRHVVFLTCDAFGVLPPIARLSPEQASLHFLCGYTAKVAGTERGVTEPQATFSACFGAPFMPLAPAVYADMLNERIARHAARCWLINTGWTGGPYGVGHRIAIEHTRALVAAALSGALDGAPCRVHEPFGLEVPLAVPSVPAEILDPRATWPDASAYDRKARHLAEQFETVHARFRQGGGANPLGADADGVPPG